MAYFFLLAPPLPLAYVAKASLCVTQREERLRERQECGPLWQFVLWGGGGALEPFQLRRHVGRI
jgi:hypothetical protein